MFPQKFILILTLTSLTHNYELDRNKATHFYIHQASSMSRIALALAKKINFFLTRTLRHDIYLRANNKSAQLL